MGTNMTRLLLLSLISICLTAMEPAKAPASPACTVTIKEPITEKERAPGGSTIVTYRFDAFCQDKRVGLSRYELLKDKEKKVRALHIKDVLVNPAYRHKADKKDTENLGVGFKLFFACYEQALKNNIPSIEWEALTQDPSISNDQLVAIYDKMITKLPSEPPFTINKKKFEYGVVEYTLTFKPKP
jgi:hypothetical protein